MWAFLAAYACGTSPVAFVYYHTPLYLSAAFHMSQTEIGRVLWIPPLGQEIGTFFWGWLLDRMLRRGASRLAWRRQLFVAMLLPLPFAAIPAVHSKVLALAILFYCLFVGCGFTMGALAYAAREYPASHSGLITGLGGGAFSALVALEMPVVGRLFDLHRYDLAFAVVPLIAMAGYPAWRVLDAKAGKGNWS
jgi:MFS family permease